MHLLKKAKKKKIINIRLREHKRVSKLFEYTILLYIKTIVTHVHSTSIEECFRDKKKSKRVNFGCTDNVQNYIAICKKISN